MPKELTREESDKEMGEFARGSAAKEFLANSVDAIVTTLMGRIDGAAKLLNNNTQGGASLIRINQMMCDILSRGIVHFMDAYVGHAYSEDGDIDIDEHKSLCRGHVVVFLRMFVHTAAEYGVISQEEAKKIMHELLDPFVGVGKVSAMMGVDLNKN